MSRFQTDAFFLLRPYVQSYWGFIRDFAQMPTFTVTPDCFAELLFFVNAPYVQTADGSEQLAACTFIPLLNESLKLKTDGVVRCAGVRLHAWAAGMVFSQPPEPTRAWYDVSAHFVDALPFVTDALHRSAFAEIAAIFDTALLRTFGRAQPAPQASNAVKAFLQRPDELPIPGTATVASQHERSRRQIERHVRLLTNQSPKQLVCLKRFEFVRDCLWAQPQRDLRDLAGEAGYADQAHLTRHFRRYASRSPAEFKAECVRLKAFLQAENVAFVQDRPQHRG